MVREDLRPQLTAAPQPIALSGQPPAMLPDLNGWLSAAVKQMMTASLTNRAVGRRHSVLISLLLRPS